MIQEEKLYSGKEKGIESVLEGVWKKKINISQ